MMHALFVYDDRPPAVVTVAPQQLPPHDVTVAVRYAAVNYKDALCVTGKGKIARVFPHVPGIDFAGEVVASDNASFAVGDAVFAAHSPIGERYWGGYAEQMVVPGEWLLPLPDGLSMRQVVALGTAGFTALLCVNAVTERVTTGPVVVSGAGGGVGSFAVWLLAQRGYDVVAVTSAAKRDYVTTLGARTVCDRADFSGRDKPLQHADYTAGIDTVGGEVLANMLARVTHNGIVAACGLAADAALVTTVMPFILRGVCLQGIDAVQYPLADRPRRWAALAAACNGALPPPLHLSEVGLADIIGVCEAMCAGHALGRTIVAL